MKLCFFPMIAFNAMAALLLSGCIGGRSANITPGAGHYNNLPYHHYTSDDCLTPDQIKIADIDLTGITLKSSCIHKNSTKDHLILESKKGYWIQMIVDKDTQIQQMSKNALAFHHSSRRHQDNLIKSINRLPIEKRERDAIINGFRTNNAAEIARYIEHLVKNYRIKTHHSKATSIDSRHLDTSLQIKFHKSGHYLSITRRLQSNQKNPHRGHRNTHTPNRQLENTVADLVNIEKRRISFLIKE